MKKCIVLGGGFAGLSASVFLASAGFKVVLFESSPKLGGRAYSFKDETTSDIIDNGQHIMMGCYDETLRFLNLIGAQGNFNIQDKLKVKFLKKNYSVFPLQAAGRLYPFNLAVAVLNYKAISFPERVSLLRLLSKLPFISEKDVSGLTVKEWLVKEKQSENVLKSFWNIIAIGALNSSTVNASAQIFLRILKQMFLRGNRAASIILPASGLSEAYCENAADYIHQHKGEIRTGETITGSEDKGRRITALYTAEGRITDFDFIISAVPDYSAGKIFPQLELSGELKYSSILSFHLWLNENPFKDDFYGLIDSPLHWIFNHKNYITLVISDANDLVQRSREELLDLVLCELKIFAGIRKEDIRYFRILKEKRATFIPSPDAINRRPGTNTAFDNLFLAGDWINTGLPATIESAVKSGRMAADAVLLKN